MSSTQGARQRFPGKSNDGDKGKTTKGRKVTEDEAVNKASKQWVRHFLIALTLSLLTPIVILIIVPSPIKPKEYPLLTPPPPFEGALILNNDLAYAEKIYDKKVVGPESLAIDGDTIYTGTADGWVNVLSKGEVKRLVQFGKEPCGGIENENTCGRPLGMRLDKDGFLVVIDAYLGLFRVNVKTGEYETLYASTTPINGKTSKFLNDLDIDDQGRVYFTETSTEWHRNQFWEVIMEGDNTGRLLVYDPKTKTTEQLVGSLMFPNGVQLLHDQSGVLVAELCRARILKYDFKLKDFSVWADGLPGFPDNIRYDKTSQTYWVGMGVVRYADKFSMLDYLTLKPWLRGILSKFVGVSNFASFKTFFAFSEPQALAVELDENAAIISSLQDRKGAVVTSVSEVHFSNGLFYMGSFHQNFIARLDWQKVPKE